MGDEYRENEDGKRLDSLKKGLVFLFSYKNMNMEKAEIYKIKGEGMVFGGTGMAYLWGGMLLIGIVYGVLSGNVDEVTKAFVSCSGEAVSLCISMAGITAMWTGMMKIAEASGTGNMKFMLNGAPTLGTMDGANVEIVDEVGQENAFIFGLSADEVINYENNGGYDPRVIYNTDDEIRQVLTELVNGTFSSDTELFRDLYNSLLNQNGGERADQYFILADFRSYAAAQKKVEEAYKDEKGWARMAMLNTACAGKFTSDRTIEEYVEDIWHLDKVYIK